MPAYEVVSPTTNFHRYRNFLSEALQCLGNDEDAHLHRQAVNALARLAETYDPGEAEIAAISLASAAEELIAYWDNQREELPRIDERAVFGTYTGTP